MATATLCHNGGPPMSISDVSYCSISFCLRKMLIGHIFCSIEEYVTVMSHLYIVSIVLSSYFFLISMSNVCRLCFPLTMYVSVTFTFRGRINKRSRANTHKPSKLKNEREREKITTCDEAHKQNDVNDSAFVNTTIFRTSNSF